MAHIIGLLTLGALLIAHTIVVCSLLAMKSSLTWVKIQGLKFLGKVPCSCKYAKSQSVPSTTLSILYPTLPASFCYPMANLGVRTSFDDKFAYLTLKSSGNNLATSSIVNNLYDFDVGALRFLKTSICAIKDSHM